MSLQAKLFIPGVESHRISISATASIAYSHHPSLTCFGQSIFREWPEASYRSARRTAPWNFPSLISCHTSQSPKSELYHHASYIIYESPISWSVGISIPGPGKNSRC